MFRNLKKATLINQRTIKNFGHKREPVPLFTTLWFGFLTFSFIGCVLDWKKIKYFIFGGSNSMVENSEEKD